jgi:hypothetical protein
MSSRRFFLARRLAIWTGCLLGLLSVAALASAAAPVRVKIANRTAGADGGFAHTPTSTRRSLLPRRSHVLAHKLLRTYSASERAAYSRLMRGETP